MNKYYNYKLKPIENLKEANDRLNELKIDMETYKDNFEDYKRLSYTSLPISLLSGTALFSLASPVISTMPKNGILSLTIGGLFVFSSIGIILTGYNFSNKNEYKECIILNDKETKKIENKIKKLTK